MTDTFTWRAEAKSQGNGEFAVYTSKFGDGYSQEVPQGLNNETQKWSVVVSGYSAYVQPALDFIRAHKGQVFFWHAPRTSAPGYYKCKRYSLSDEGGAYWTLTLEFEQGYLPV